MFRAGSLLLLQEGKGRMVCVNHQFHTSNFTPTRPNNTQPDPVTLFQLLCGSGGDRLG